MVEFSIETFITALLCELMAFSSYVYAQLVNLTWTCVTPNKNEGEKRGEIKLGQLRIP